MLALASVGALAATLGVTVVPQERAVAAPEIVVRTQEDAAAKAAQTGKPVEIPDQTSETSQTFVNPDGTLTAKLSNAPVRVKRDNQWRAVDSTLEFRADGSVGPKAAVSDVTLSGGGEGLLGKVGVEAGSWQLNSPWKLPRPTLEGAKATYAEVMPGVDLVTEATTDGFSYNVVVKNRTAAANPALKSIHFPVTTSDLSIRPDHPGGPAYVGKDGKLAVAMGSAIMWDSAVPGAKGKTGTTRSATQAVEAGPAGAHAAQIKMTGSDSGLTLQPDTTLLNGLSTVYPVVLDPVVWTPVRTAWAAAWQLYPTQSFYKTTHSLGVGYEDFEQHKIVRSFFQFSTTAFKGKKILAATLRTYEVHSASCAARSVTVTRTGPISAATTWNNQPAAQLEAGALSFAHGYNSSCPDAYVEFPVTNSMVDTAAKGYTTSTFRLRATNEADGIAWKQFNSTGFLEVTFVSPPAVPRRLGLTSPAAGCDDSTAPVNVGETNIQFGVTPMLSATDVGARAQAEIQIYTSAGALAKTLKTGLETPGTAQTATIPLSQLQDQMTYHYRARTLYPYSATGVLASAYTIWCYFKIDKLAPPAPTVTAKYGTTVLPTCTLSSTNCPAIVPFGAAISYTFKANAADVTRHQYWYAGVARTFVNGNTVTVNLVPKQQGWNLLTVVSYDAANHFSVQTQFLVNVQAAAPPIADWSFDGPDGSTAADSASPAHPLTLSGGAAFDDAGRNGGSLKLDGVDDYAETPTTIVDTSKSFTVSAWARLSSTKEAVLVGAAGNVASAFELYYSVSLNRWVFMRIKTDTMQPVNVKALSDEPAVLGAWTQVTGVYDAGIGRIRLYINGRLQTAGDVAYPDSAWKATGPLSVGQGQYNDVFGNRFVGSIDAVQIWQRALTPEAVMDEQEIRKDDQVVASQAARWPLDSAYVSADQVWRTGDTVYGANMPISGFAGGGDQSAAFVEDEERGSVLQFSGSAAEALSLPRAVVDGGASFSVAVRVKLADPHKPQVIARQAGTDRDAWRLEWKPRDVGTGQWIFTRASAKTGEPEAVAALDDDIDSITNDWRLIIGSYDASSQPDSNQGALGAIDITVDKAPGDGNKDRFATPYRLGSTVVGKGRAAGAEYAGRLDDLRMYVGPLRDDAVCREFPDLDPGICPQPAG